MKIALLLTLLTSLASFATDFKTNYAAKALASLNKPTATAPMPDPNAKAKATENLNSASLLFIENNGQVADNEGKLHPEILFTAKAAGAQVYVTGNSLHYVFTKVDRAKSNMSGLRDDRDSIKSVSTHRFTLELEGANPKPELIKQGQNPYYENYYLAHCPNGVVAHSYEKFTLKGVYPGVDWVIYSNGQGLKYDFVLAKGSDASKIRIKVKDADASLNAEGDLVMNTSLGKVVEDKPVSFQAGRKLETSFKELGNQTYGFEVNANANQPLTIDPSVAWATYYGGSGKEYGNSCTTDAQGNVYIAGCTLSGNFPVSGAFQGTYIGGGSNGGDAFLVKFTSSGNRLWATYYGGSGDDTGCSSATDVSGNVYMPGQTSSTDFPVSGAFQGTYARGYDAFLVKFNGSGSRLWATFYGGSNLETSNSCATDASDNVYLAGSTSSSNFPVSGAFQGTYGGSGTFSSNAYLVKFTSSGTRLWATYYGGNNGDTGNSCATDALGNVYLSGLTNSSNFPVLAPFQMTYGGGLSDAYLVKFSSSGNRLWATYYGGSADDAGNSCALDNSGNVYLTGFTVSRNFPVSGAFQGTFGGGNLNDPDAFLVKFTSSGNRLWATYYGGSTSDYGNSCATDASGNVYLTGYTRSSNFPVLRAFQGTLSGIYDAFLVKFASSGNRLWATYYGGNDRDQGASCATDALGNVYLIGNTGSSNLAVLGAFQGTYSGSEDAFIVKIADSTITSLAPQSNIPSLSLHPNPASTTVQLNYADIKQVDVIDQLGRTVIRTKEVPNNCLDIRGLAAGTYLVRVVTGSGGTMQTKLVVE